VYHSKYYKVELWKEVGMQNMLDTKAVAQMLGKSEWWVRANREALELPAFRIGSKLRFKEEEVIKWLESKCRT
jgi:predicted DNA-binding transcriptional regulator AlpA